MDAGLASVSKKDACALIVNFLCLTAPESSKLGTHTPQRDEVCIMQSNRGGPGSRIKPAGPTTTIKDIALFLSILRVHTQHTP